MSLSYAWQKFYTAVSGMALHKGSLQARLEDAAFSLSTLREADFPEGELRTAFLGIMQAVASHPVRQGHQGARKATTQAMEEYEAEAVIERIVSLYDNVTRRLTLEACVMYRPEDERN